MIQENEKVPSSPWNFMPFKVVDMAVGLTKLLTGAHGVFKSPLQEQKQTVFFANHCSNMDTIVLWATLPKEIRKKTRPVAALDYWNVPGIRQHIATKELNVVFIDRNNNNPQVDVLDPLRKALQEGFNIIIFPEGKRNDSLVPQVFKSGIYHLYQEFTEVDFVPVYLENVGKTFPKGAIVPLPLICRAYFGERFEFKAKGLDGEQGNEKRDFLFQARQAIVHLAPAHISNGYKYPST